MSTLVKITTRDIDGLLDSLSRASSLTDLTETRARIEAARAWAKVHNQVREMRLDLLRVEVEALVRIVELGGLATLPARDRKSAEYLAAMTREERSRLVQQSGTSTTAAGMCRSIFLEEELERERAFGRTKGRRFADGPPMSDGDRVEAAKDRVAAVSAVLAEVVASYTSEDSQAFTVEDIAEDVINAAALGDAVDPAVREGVREVCRTALRRAPVIEIDGTRLPRLITARDAEGSYVRIPVENALLSHLDEMRDLRREQLAQDSAALDALDAVARKLRSLPGAADESRIGQLVTQSVTRKAGAA